MKEDSEEAYRKIRLSDFKESRSWMKEMEIRW